MGSEFTEKVQKRTFIVKMKPLKFVHARGNYNCGTNTVKLTNTNMYDVELHLWLNCLTQ